MERKTGRNGLKKRIKGAHLSMKEMLFHEKTTVK